MRAGDFLSGKSNAHKNSNRFDINRHCFGHAFRIPIKDAHLCMPRSGIGPDGSEIRESRVFGLETEFERTWLNPWMLDDDEPGLIGVSSAETIEFRTVYEEYGIRISAFRFVIYQIA